MTLWDDIPVQHANFKSSSQESQAVRLCENGQFSKACKRLISEPLCTRNAETVKQMQEKHPSARHPLDMSSIENPPDGVHLLAENDVKEAIFSFH